MIRLATINDIEDLVNIRIKFLREINDLKDNEEEELQLKDSLKNYFSQKIPKNEFKAWIAEKNGIIIATSGLTIFRKLGYRDNISGIEGYIANMYTLPEWRNKGIGNQLLTKIIDYMKTTNAKKISLHSEEAAISLYQKYGFKREKNAMKLFLK